ncbi:MarR family winged helix-turn-helix transcriptional regulator [Allosphingosinicella vermicomposti]|uniref:MarR family winged helix-turn-helix transcriptional regulator n=1 Tax=Allosphingosinicella vermicomposti TaxID=614671 RepID=UPI00131A4CC8|nr:MarR family transcriptional regulator [Allosphingosinicella vermicomposti]
MADFSIADMQALRVTGLGRLLMNASRRYNDRAIEMLRSAGHARLSAAHAMILPHIDVEGTRLTDIASRAGVTKQSASEMVQDLERIGYVRRERDALDKRAVKVTFSALGHQFLKDAYAVHLQLERELSVLLLSEADMFKNNLRRWAQHADGFAVGPDA